MAAPARAQVDRVEVVGLDEAYLDLSGLERPQGRRAAGQGGRARRHRPRLLDRHRAEQAGRQGGLGRGQARRLPRPDRERGVRALRRALPRADPRHRAQDAWSACSSRGIETLGQLAASRTRSWPSGSAGVWARTCGRLARFEDDRPLETVAGPQVGVARDDVRPRPARLRGARARARAADRASSARTWTATGRGGRTVGIKVRLDDFSTHTRARTLPAPRGRRGGGSARGARAAAAPSIPSARAPARRAGRGARRAARARAPSRRGRRAARADALEGFARYRVVHTVPVEPNPSRRFVADVRSHSRPAT